MKEDKTTVNKITLCGSTRFKKEFLEFNRILTFQKNVVYSVAFFGHADAVPLTREQKGLLDEIHLAKIANSDEIFVLDVGEYIGDSTLGEIEYAKLINKMVRYLSDEYPEYKYGVYQPSPTPPETVEEKHDKASIIGKAKNDYAHELYGVSFAEFITKYDINEVDIHRIAEKVYDSCSEWQLRQQLNFPENKQEQLNWFLVNALRLFDDNQLKVLTKEIGERCGALRPMWQLCPKCNGQGIVSKPPHIAGDVQQWVSTASSFTCDVCNGAKIIAQPPISK